jgi:acyl carrier protein
MSTEMLVTQIFESVIGVRNLKPDSRFIDVGGNSLNLVAVLKQIKDKTGVAAPPRIFFDKKYATIAAISAAIDSQREENNAKETVAN